MMVHQKNLEEKCNEDLNKLKIKVSDMQDALSIKEQRCLSLEYKIKNLNLRCEVKQIFFSVNNNNSKYSE